MARFVGRADPSDRKTKPRPPPLSAATIQRRPTCSGNRSAQFQVQPMAVERKACSAAHHASASVRGRTSKQRSQADSAKAGSGLRDAFAEIRHHVLPPLTAAWSDRIASSTPPAPSAIHHSTTLPATQPPPGSRTSSGVMPVGTMAFGNEIALALRIAVLSVSTVARRSATTAIANLNKYN